MVCVCERIAHRGALTMPKLINILMLLIVWLQEAGWGGFGRQRIEPIEALRHGHGPRKDYAAVVGLIVRVEQAYAPHENSKALLAAAAAGYNCWNVVIYAASYLVML